MILVDTGFIIPLVRPQDALRKRALAWAERIREPLLLPEYVAAETPNALAHPLHRQAAADLIESMSRRSDCEFGWVDQGILADALQLYRERHDKTWSLTDCASFVLMRRRNIQQALAYDHHFEQAGFAALLRRDP